MHFIVAFVVFGFKKNILHDYKIDAFRGRILQVLTFFKMTILFFLRVVSSLMIKQKIFIEIKTWFKTLFYICNLFIELIQF